MDADAAAVLASQRLETSGWPAILTRAVSGRLLLKLHSGPANSQGVAGVEVSGTQYVLGGVGGDGTGSVRGVDSLVY